MTRESKVQTSAAKPVDEESATVVAVPDEEVTTAGSPPEPAAPVAEAASGAEAARARAAVAMSERRYADAKKGLEEAEAIDAGSAMEEAPQKVHRRVLSAVRYQLNRLPKRSKPAEEAPAAPAPDPEAAVAAMEPEDRAVAIVGLYSKIAAVAGLVPGGLLNFAAILAVQVTMVWRIANTFGHRETKTRIRAVILALLGSAVPTGVGGGIMFAIRRIPAFVAGTIAGFVVTPVVAYAMTKAVGNTFVMHFESGGTLLDFDPKAFRDYFIKEFQEASGTAAAPASN